MMLVRFQLPTLGSVWQQNYDYRRFPYYIHNDLLPECCNFVTTNFVGLVLIAYFTVTACA
ncbi:hypothetical protein [Limosilactobacillus vaginalis]|uniref:hypothetical protein n=1 Tax=Limosilactobacillus vaginalis TaxID=1633 RepID=UPI00242C58FA|nr:hypothetical protein [Limosilactobacillus vaginalis]